MPANAPIDRPADDVLASLDERTAQDAQTLVAMMHRITGHEPVVWNVATLGFDSYHFRYDSGREGDCHALGFHPRNGKLTIYLMDGTERHAALLSQLGKHTTSRVCVYLTRLGGIDLEILDQVLQASYAYVKAHDGTMHRA
ncbi:MAG TPA: DUF1801 domain-containing protein [Candidatus Nanopelagicales bacterium]|nr:DUF1801 domain-containing protein [Candidatus Nanopelagicales bacterium]